METLQRLSDALGSPQSLRMLCSGSHTLAAVGRWRHSGATVDLGRSDCVQLVFNVVGGQRVELSGVARGTVRAGSIGLVRPESSTRVSISGEADTVQLLLSEELVGRSLSELSTGFDLRQPRLQALGAQALVALARDPARLALIVEQVAAELFVVREASEVALPPITRVRVHEFLEARVEADPCVPPRLEELADLAGLSVNHFVATYRRSEGETPYARFNGRRLDLALMLLLQGDSRVDQIADRVGFSSPSHFVSAFRRRLGVTPGAVREAARGSD